MKRLLPEELIQPRRLRPVPLSDELCAFCGKLLPIEEIDYHATCKQLKEKLRTATQKRWGNK